MKICFLASGGGGNFKFLHLAKKLKIIRNIELSLIADRECRALEYAIISDTYSKKIIYRQENNIELLEELEKINPDIIVTTWYKIIDDEVVQKYNGRLINLHYSLLPAFSGLIGTEPIKKAYENNCQYVGVTCHFVDEGVDSGKIISQALLKTNVPMEEAIQIIFQKGCLVLLNSILQLTDENIIEKHENEKWDYSPNLLFDDSKFSSKFWIKLSKI